jgi:hypothetical protein
MGSLVLPQMLPEFFLATPAWRQLCLHYFPLLSISRPLGLWVCNYTTLRVKHGITIAHDIPKRLFCICGLAINLSYLQTIAPLVTDDASLSIFLWWVITFYKQLLSCFISLMVLTYKKMWITDGFCHWCFI